MPSWLSLLRNGLAGTRNTHSGHSRLPSSHMSQHLTCDMDRLRWGFLVWLFQFLATQMARSQRPWPFSALSHARPFPFVGDAEFTKYSSPLRQFGGWGFLHFDSKQLQQAVLPWMSFLWQPFFGSHLVPEMQWVVSSLSPCDVACYMESQRELSLRDAVCSTEHRTMPDRIWIAITFLAFTDDSGATYPVKAHVTLGRFEIQNDQDVTDVIAAAQRACDAVNAKLRRWATRSNLWSARTKNRDRPFPCHSHCNGNVFMCKM